MVSPPTRTNADQPLPPPGSTTLVAPPKVFASSPRLCLHLFSTTTAASAGGLPCSHERRRFFPLTYQHSSHSTHPSHRHSIPPPASTLLYPPPLHNSPFHTRPSQRAQHSATAMHGLLIPLAYLSYTDSCTVTIPVETPFQRASERCHLGLLPPLHFVLFCSDLTTPKTACRTQHPTLKRSTPSPSRSPSARGA